MALLNINPNLGLFHFFSNVLIVPFTLFYLYGECGVTERGFYIFYLHYKLIIDTGPTWKRLVASLLSAVYGSKPNY